MGEWSVILIAVSLLAIIGLFGMIGCGLQSDPFTVGTGDGEGGGNGNGNGPKPNSDLVSEWLLGDLPNNDAADSVDSHPGTYTTINLPQQPQSPGTPDPPVLTNAEPSLLPGMPNSGCVLMNGGFVNVPFDPALNTPQFSVMAWCLPDYDPTETVDGQLVFRCVLASREGNGVQPAGFMIYSGPDLSNPTDTTIYWQAWVGDGTPGGAWQMLIGPPITANETTHLAVTYDGATLMLYVDATVAPPMTTGYSPNTSKSLYIGMGAPDAQQPAYPFKGRLQDVRYYKAAQPASVLADIVTAGQTAP